MSFNSKTYPHFVGIFAFIFLLANIVLFYKIFIAPQLVQEVPLGAEGDDSMLQEYGKGDTEGSGAIDKRNIVAKFTLNCSRGICCSFGADYIKAKIQSLTLVLNASVKDVKVTTEHKWNFEDMKLDFIFGPPLDVAGPIANICFNEDAVVAGFSINVELEDKQEAKDYKALLEIK